jgi:hypothetical protein
MDIKQEQQPSSSSWFGDPFSFKKTQTPLFSGWIPWVETFHHSNYIQAVWGKTYH